MIALANILLSLITRIIQSTIHLSRSMVLIISRKEIRLEISLLSKFKIQALASRKKTE